MRRLRNALLFIILALASASGAPMVPDEVEELMRAMDQPKIVHTLQEEDYSGDDPTATPLPDDLQ